MEDIWEDIKWIFGKKQIEANKSITTTYGSELLVKYTTV